jgi:multidrug efflux pump subunit AcrA (membrane-fusion protein)
MALIPRMLLAVGVRLGSGKRRRMKPRSIVILLTLAATTVSLAFATPQHKNKISLAEPTIVANLWLRPGKYTVKWNSVGGNKVDISFVQGTRTIATVPGTIQAVRNGRDVAPLLGEIDGSGARPLIAIEMRDSTLLFQVVDVSSGKTL